MRLMNGDLRVALEKNLRDYLGIFPNMREGGGLPNSQNFCKLTKYFLCAKFILKC